MKIACKAEHVAILLGKYELKSVGDIPGMYKNLSTICNPCLSNLTTFNPI
jgi:hypothetical protein